MIIKTTEVVLISGQRGTGKSTLLRMIARRAKKVIVYDPLFEHGMLGVKTRNVEDVAQLDRVVFQPINNDEKTFEDFCRTIWNKRDNVLVFIDEVDEHADLYNLPPFFGRLVRLGRHKGIGVIGITRRIANVNKTLPALSHHIISFRQTLPNDVAYLADFITWDNASKLKTLPDFCYLHFDWKTATIGKTRMDRQQPVQEEARIEPGLSHEKGEFGEKKVTTEGELNSVPVKKVKKGFF